MVARVISVGYGRPALDALRSVVTEAKHEDPMAPVTIMVPNNIAGIVARRHLAHGLEGRGSGVAGIFVTTLPRLAEQLAGPALFPRRPATHPIVAAAWRGALENDPGCFEQVREHPATVRALVNAHRELRDLTPTARDNARAATTLSPDLVRLHEDVVGSLSTEWYDTTDLLTAAATLTTEHPDRTQEFGEIVLYLPKSLSQAESGFARALVQYADLTVIAGMTGVQRADEAVRRTLSRLGLEAPEQTPKPPIATKVMHASDSDDEVRCVVRAVIEALTATKAHRIAVLYGRPTPYARLFHEHLTASGITVNGPSTRAVGERAIARGFLGILELAHNSLPRADTFVALAEAPTLTCGGDRVPVARWERVSRLAGIVNGEDWAPRLQTYVDHERAVIAEQEASADPWPSRIEASQREIDTAETLGAFVENLRTRLQVGESKSTWSDLSSWALDLFHDLYGRPESLKLLPPEEQYAAVVVESSLSRLTTLDMFEQPAGLTTLIEVLALELESALPRVGRFGEGVFVGPISAAIGMDLDTVFVVGLAEDGYPGRLHEDALLNDRVRDATDGELESSRARLDAKHRHLLAAFASAPEVIASFPRGDLRRSTRRLPSRWLIHTLRKLAGNKELAATEWEKATSEHLIGSESFAESLTHTEHPSSEQEWQVRAASAMHPLADDVVDHAKAMLAARRGDAFTRYDGNLSGCDGLPDFAREDRAISPTSLEAFALCPHRYFVQKMLRIEPLEHPEEVITISPMEIGNFIHACMDELITEYEAAGRLPSYGEAWSDGQRDRLREIATAKAADFAAKGATGHPLLWEPEKTRILLDLDRMLDDDDQWRAHRDAKVRSSELMFGRDGKDPVSIKVDGGEVRMLGSIDMIDETRDGVLLVTDIKSGKAEKFKPIKDDPVVAGTKLQLPVYAYAARQLLGGDEVESMYWFVRRDAGTRIPVVLDDGLERKYAETIGTLTTSIATGLFPAKPSEKPGYRYVDCSFCDPDGMGDGDARERYRRKRLDPALRRLVDLIDPGAVERGDAEVGDGQ